MNKSFQEFKDFIRDKKTAVVGIGVSNIPLIRFLQQLGAKVSAFDKKSREELGEIGDEFEGSGVKLILGEHYLDKLTGYQVIFKTPSMRIDSIALKKAKLEGAYITSEMEEFIRYCPAKIYGVTGSDGKTTTTTILYKLLCEQGFNTWVGGNIGNPLFSNIEEISKKDRVVLELSSFQLMTMDVSPEVAVVTNLSPNHLDMHKDMEEYVNSKKNIFLYQKEDGLLVINGDNEITSSFEREAKGHLRKFSRQQKPEDGAYYEDNILYVMGKPVCAKDEIVIRGMHNVENYLAAFAAACDEVEISVMKKVALSFKGVAHRGEFIREFNGVKYYNDSIASSPTRAVATLKAFDKPAILIAGGYDKNLPFEPLAEEGHPYIKRLILLGATRYKIKEVFDKLKEAKGIDIPVHMVNSLEEAVEKARSIAETGDIVSLSPACASFDMFVNFEARGNRFRELVASLE